MTIVDEHDSARMGENSSHTVVLLLRRADVQATREVEFLQRAPQAVPVRVVEVGEAVRVRRRRPNERAVTEVVRASHLGDREVDIPHRRETLRHEPRARIGPLFGQPVVVHADARDPQVNVAFGGDEWPTTEARGLWEQHLCGHAVFVHRGEAAPTGTYAASGASKYRLTGPRPSISAAAPVPTLRTGASL